MLKNCAMLVGIGSLAGTVLPAAVFMLQAVALAPGEAPLPSLDTVKAIMLVSAIGWFAAAPAWMRVE